MSVFKPEIGQQVRVVKCSEGNPEHASKTGRLRECSRDGGGWDVYGNWGSCCATEVAPVWQVGEVVTAEMGEPPVGSVVEDADGDTYERVTQQHLAHWSRRTSVTSFVRWDDLVRYIGGVRLASLPEQPVSADPVPQPQTREVDPKSARDGDRITINGILRDRNRNSMVGDRWFCADDMFCTAGALDRPDDDGLLVTERTIVVTRGMPVLKPGITGTATVRNVPNMKVIRTFAFDTVTGGEVYVWATPYEDVQGEIMHREKDVTDFVPDGAA